MTAVKTQHLTTFWLLANPDLVRESNETLQMNLMIQLKELQDQ